MDEHNHIVQVFSKMSNNPKRKPNLANIRPLTGLVKCGLCGHTMGFCSNNNKREILKHCWYKDLVGVKCKNRGMVTEYIYIYIYILKYKEKLMDKITNLDIDSEREVLQKQIMEHNYFTEKKRSALQRIQDAYEDGVYTLEQYKQRKVKIEKEISEINEDIQLLKIKMEKFSIEDLNKKLYKIERVLTEIDNVDLSDGEKNKLYKTIIDKIVWIRDNNNVSIKTTFK